MVWPEHFPPECWWGRFLICIKEFEEQLGQKMKAEFWEKAIDWNDRNGCFGDLVRKLTAELKDTTASEASPGSGPA